MLLVTGAVGMAGWHVVREALARNMAVQGLWHRESPVRFTEDGVDAVPMHCLDLLDSKAVENLLARLQPSAVVHCASLTNVDGCEDTPEQTMAINAHASGVLAGAAAACGARFVFFSTDSVFDGSRPGWAEDDEARPLNVYGQSKLEGERLVLAAHPGAVAMRTNFYGKHPCDDRALAGWIFSRFRGDDDVPGFTDVIFSPLWVGHLAQLILRLVTEETLVGVNGLLNLAGPESISKYDLARKLAIAGGYDPERVKPALSTSVAFRAKRPANTVLNVQRAQGLLGKLPTMDEGIKAFVDDLSSRDSSRLCEDAENDHG